MNLDTDFGKLIEKVPIFIQEKLKTHRNKDQLIEIVLDLGRRPEARFGYGPEHLSQKLVSWQDLDYLTKRISKFSTENRSGIERSLHRISCIRNRQFLINGFTCRVGRAVFGGVSTIRDLLESDKSILILGKPGVGKTTIIREIARVLTDDLEKRVVIVDTANEIGGDSDIPHLGIGGARRMQVPKTELQHQVMIEAVENHMPQVIIIDEIGTELEVLAARTIAEKGVQLVGTTHGSSLDNVVNNPLLGDLMGGIKYVTLGDEEAKRRGTKKSILERKASPAFEILIEVNESNLWTIHENVTLSIDNLLTNNSTVTQTRTIILSEKTEIKYHESRQLSNFHLKTFSNFRNFMLSEYTSWSYSNNLFKKKSLNLISKTLVIYSYSISSNFLQESFLKIGVKVRLTNKLKNATCIIGLKKKLQANLKLKKLANEKKIPIYSLNQINIYQLTKLIKALD